jgi:hypothetical protein
MERSENITGLTAALIKFQSGMKALPKDKVNPYFHSKYADLAGIWEAIRKPLADNKLAVSQLPRDADGRTVLTTLLVHESGEWVSSDLPVTVAKESDPQAVGSALTYARRYALSALLGIVSEEDDDAEAATRHKQEGEQPQAQPSTDHWCSEHKVPFFKKGNMKGYAHPVKDGEGNTIGWCNEAQKVEEHSPDEPPSDAPSPSTGNTREEAEAIARGIKTVGGLRVALAKLGLDTQATQLAALNCQSFDEVKNDIAGAYLLAWEVQHG